MPVIITELDIDSEPTVERGADRTEDGGTRRETWHGPEMGVPPSRAVQELHWGEYHHKNSRLIKDMDVGTPFNEGSDAGKKRERAIIGQIGRVGIPAGPGKGGGAKLPN